MSTAETLPAGGLRVMPGTAARVSDVATPRVIAYEYQARSYPWADRRLALAEAEHGKPPSRRGPPPRSLTAPAGPVPVPASAVKDCERCEADRAPFRYSGSTNPGPPPERCEKCGYLLTSVSHRIECGEDQ